MHTAGAQFRLRCFWQTLSVSIFLLTFPCPAWTAIPPGADGPPSLSQIEALRPIRRCATDATVIGIVIFGCVVWSHGTCGIQTSLCVSADYICPELRRFSVNPLCICLILTGAWFGALSRVCLHTYYPVYCLRFCPPGYVHLYVEC